MSLYPQIIMLLGEHRHTLDTKKRVSVPAGFRKVLGKTVVITHGLDRCLFVYSKDAWRDFTQKLGELSMGQADTRAFARFFLGGAVETEIDKAGRILIPDFLKDFANLDSKVVLAGVGDRIEVWNEDAWGTYKESVESKADVLAQKLGEVGMI